MKRSCISLVFCVLFLCGCVEQQKSGSQAVKNINTKSVPSKFPDFLVGVWEANEFNWGFKFEPDGKISKLTHTMGVPINVAEGGYDSENKENKSSGTFVLGPCNANYDPKTGILKVSIILDYYRIEIPTGVLEGSSKDLFEGPVSEKDLTWKTNWRGYSILEGASLPDANLIDANPVKLVFKKLDLEKLKSQEKAEIK
jgi:hypothetical protein